MSGLEWMPFKRRRREKLFIIVRTRLLSINFTSLVSLLSAFESVTRDMHSSCAALTVFCKFCCSLYFIFLFHLDILLTRRKATEALMHRASNYPDLFFEMPMYCCPVEIFFCLLVFNPIFVDLLYLASPIF